jgi:hypothetical protein
LATRANIISAVAAKTMTMTNNIRAGTNANPRLRLKLFAFIDDYQIYDDADRES